MRCATRTVDGIEADAERCRELLERSTAAATSLSPYIGYAKTAEIAKAAVATGRVDSRARARARADGRAAARSHSVGGAMTRPGIAGREAMMRRSPDPPSARAGALVSAQAHRVRP